MATKVKDDQLQQQLSRADCSPTAIHKRNWDQNCVCAVKRDEERLLNKTASDKKQHTDNRTNNQLMLPRNSRSVLFCHR
jgi:hypothetical protein